jgi:orotidine-5'-phosphate decarboxylase
VQKQRLIVALDFPAAPAALALVDRLQPGQCRLKVGQELFTRAGPALVETLIQRGFDVFLDLKFHDIPNTVAAACRAAAELGVWMLDVHAQGGRAMLAAARAAVDSVDSVASVPQRPWLLGVTVLTSLDETTLAEVGVFDAPAQQVLRLAQLAFDSGLDGVVCSAQEASRLRTAFGPAFCLVTPGIRPAGWHSADDDQRRVLSAADALRAGADYLVVGRPVTQAADPLAALAALHADIQQHVSSA